RLIRYSEVLLWYAEAQARADGTPNAMAYECLNKVRERAGLEPVSGLSGSAFADAAFKEHGWEVAGYWVGMVTRRDDQMRMELLEQTFNERKTNTPIEVAPGVSIAETVLIPDATTWQGEKSIYLPYPSTDKQQNSNLTR
ncbi:RagB/SusD family nutrient uptake outer membrane protein, partial [Parabacteroides goldsteinii]